MEIRSHRLQPLFFSASGLNTLACKLWPVWYPAWRDHCCSCSAGRSGTAGAQFWTQTPVLVLNKGWERRSNLTNNRIFWPSVACKMIVMDSQQRSLCVDCIYFFKMVNIVLKNKISRKRENATKIYPIINLRLQSSPYLIIMMFTYLLVYRFWQEQELKQRTLCWGNPAFLRKNPRMRIRVCL